MHRKNLEETVRNKITEAMETLQEWLPHLADAIETAAEYEEHVELFLNFDSIGYSSEYRFEIYRVSRNRRRRYVEYEVTLLGNEDIKLNLNFRRHRRKKAIEITKLKYSAMKEIQSEAISSKEFISRLVKCNLNNGNSVLKYKNPRFMSFPLIVYALPELTLLALKNYYLKLKEAGDAYKANDEESEKIKKPELDYFAQELEKAIKEKT